MYLTHKNLADYYVLDIEANGLRPTIIWVVCVKNIATGERWHFRDRATFASFVKSRGHCKWIMHNGISYDSFWLAALWGTTLPLDDIVDTLVLSTLYHPKMPGGHSLEAWGIRLKHPKVEHDDWSQFSPAMLARCEGDVELTERVFKALTARMRQRGFSELSCWIEHNIRDIIDEQERNGFKFDIPAAEGLYAELRETERRLAVPIRELFPPVLVLQNEYDYRVKQNGEPYASYLRHLEEWEDVRWTDEGHTRYGVYGWEEFNIGSPVQRVQRLLDLGWKPEKLTKSGNPSADEDSIVAFAESSGEPRVRAIADWLVVNGRANMISTWLDNVNRDDGCMHGKVWSCGAASRRMTHSSPNTANIPGNEARYGHEVRSLWTARTGRKLVGIDAKSIQMRCFANVLPDPNAGRRYWDTDFCPDPHQENAEVIGIARRPVKNVFYAKLFGAYPPKLARTAGREGSKKELNEYGTWISKELDRLTPGLGRATQLAKEEWRANGGFLSCPDGGFVRCPDESASFNYKIQPSEVCVMKLASIRLRQELRRQGVDYMKVGDIHDEWQFDTAPDATAELGRMGSAAIAQAGQELNFRVPLAGDSKVGESWADTH